MLKAVFLIQGQITQSSRRQINIHSIITTEYSSSIGELTKLSLKPQIKPERSDCTNAGLRQPDADYLDCCSNITQPHPKLKYKQALHSNNLCIY